MVRQLEFYFSDLNLNRDAFLQRQLRRNGGEHAGKRNASNVAFDWLK